MSSCIFPVAVFIKFKVLNPDSAMKGNAYALKPGKGVNWFFLPLPESVSAILY